MTRRKPKPTEGFRERVLSLPDDVDDMLIRIQKHKDTDIDKYISRLILGDYIAEMKKLLAENIRDEQKTKTGGWLT